jgi:hypothetical protein
MKLSGGNVASTYKWQAPYLCVGHCFGITLSEARRNLFRRSGMGNAGADAYPRGAAVAQRLRSAPLDGVRGRRMTPDLANMAKPSAVTFFP